MEPNYRSDFKNKLIIMYAVTSQISRLPTRICSLLSYYLFKITWYQLNQFIKKQHCICPLTTTVHNIKKYLEVLIYLNRITAR